MAEEIDEMEKVPEKVLNIWGEEVPEDDQGDTWAVPVEERQDDDSGEGSNALYGGDDLGDWVPEDFYAKHPEMRPEEPVEVPVNDADLIGEEE